MGSLLNSEYVDRITGNSLAIPMMGFAGYLPMVGFHRSGRMFASILRFQRKNALGALQKMQAQR